MGDNTQGRRNMRKATVKKLKKELQKILGDKPMTPWIWRKHKKAYMQVR